MWTPLLLVLLSVSLVGAMNYAFVRQMERKFSTWDPIYIVMVEWMVLVLLFFVFVTIGGVVALLLLVGLLVFCWIGGLAHRASGGVSRGSSEAWSAMIVAAEITLIEGALPLGYLVLSYSFRVGAMSVSWGLLALVLVLVAFISPSAAAIFLRMFQCLQLRPGIDRSLREGEKLDGVETTDV